MNFSVSTWWIFFQSVKWNLNIFFFFFNIAKYDFTQMTQKNTSVGFFFFFPDVSMCGFCFSITIRDTLVIASVSDHSFGSWGLICNKKKQTWEWFFFCMLKWLWELMSEPTAHQECIKMSFAALIRFSHRSFLWSNSGHKRRRHFLECWENESLWHSSSKGHKRRQWSSLPNTAGFV